MTDIAGQAHLERARDAASRGDWRAAYDLLVRADAEGHLEPDDLALLAQAAYASGRLETTIATWERIHAVSLAAGDRVAAAGAAVRVAIHLLIDTGLMAPIRGWTRRAERLLEDMDDTPVHAWIAMLHTYERFFAGDYPSARTWARRAIELGAEQGVPEPAAFGRMADARIHIFEGNVDEGLARLDEAAVAVVSGELDQMAVGMLYCELLCALQGLAQNDRAEEWTQAYERWRSEHNIGSLGGRCRLHRADLLRQRGECAAAEAEARLACDELRPYLRLEFGWPLTVLGNIALRLGDLEGAEDAFVEAHEIGWEPQPGLALLRLANGDASGAASSIADALDHPLNVPSKEVPPNTDLRRAPLLEAQVEIAIAAGDIEQARRAADDLERIASAFASRTIDASAALSRGRVHLASGDTADARREFDRSRLLWSEVPAPFEAAIARMGLADAYRAEGNEDRALTELRAARSTFERIGASLHAALARQAVGDDGSVAHTDDVPATPFANEFRCNGDHWTITYDGKSVTIRDLRGLGYLCRLLGQPGREFHVLDLATDSSVDPASRHDGAQDGLSAPTDAGPLLDQQAKDQYKRRLADIDDDLQEAEAFGDEGRAARARAERDFLVRELSRAIGLGGRDRRAGSASERARASVTQAVRHAMARITEHHPDLGEHLARTVRTGTYCVYLPDTRVPVAWTS
jgi:tetratricopeptide (TPR) repeat protein